MIMLPIPVPIIGSNKRLFIPLIYLIVTTSICYLFLIALVGINNNNRNTIPSQSSNNKLAKIRNTFTKYKRQVDLNLIFESSSDQAKVNTLSWKSIKKKEKETNSKNTTGQYGTWRSDSTEIRFGHQDHYWLVDDVSPSYVPWPHDQQCRTFQVHFAKKETFKSRALVSFPGSGNSWLRYLIECSTGFFTGSVFSDKNIYSNGLLGELRAPNDGSTIVQKTHHDTTYLSSNRTRQAYVKLTELMFGYRGILLIRNPYNALISYWNFINTRDHKGHANQHNFSNFKWIKFVTGAIPRWTSLITSWVENSQDLLIVQYEKLRKNPHDEMIRILKYLDQPINQSRLNCLVKTDHVEGPFHRHHSDSFNNSTAGSETKEKNFVHFFSKKPGWNSKSWQNGEQQSLIQNVEENMSPNNHYDPPLDLIVQDNIDKINRFFQEKGIPILLDYTGPSACCST